MMRTLGFATRSEPKFISVYGPSMHLCAEGDLSGIELRDLSIILRYDP